MESRKVMLDSVGSLPDDGMRGFGADSKIFRGVLNLANGIEL